MKNNKKYLIHIIIIFIIILTICPFLWMILTSLKTFQESIQIPPDIFPKIFQWHNYSTVFKQFPFLAFYFNTFASVIGVVIGQVIVSSMAAYAFAKIEFPGRDVLFVIMLALLMIPSQVFIIPQFQIMVKLHLTDTVIALILPGIFNVFGTFLLRQFFMSIPKELTEAALIDGCNHFQIYYKVMLPLVKPALIALSILTAMWTWQSLLWPLIVNSSLNKETLSAGLALLIGQHNTVYPLVMAAGVLSIWPMIIIFFVFQKKFIEGISISGSKG
ncbi:MAG TPA: carbohydrate ABC transporter permease [Victivallales bacterium]|nr:carbohydrate ABC transporter permease [Victivallales bacterium]